MLSSSGPTGRQALGSVGRTINVTLCSPNNLGWICSERVRMVTVTFKGVRENCSVTGEIDQWRHRAHDEG